MRRGSLCGGQASADERAQLMMATSPAEFDARLPGMMGGFSAVGPVKDQQDCFACVAFAVLGAVQSAISCALREDATSALSEQDYYFCKSVMGTDQERTCTSSWRMEDGIMTFIRLAKQGVFPTRETCLPFNPSNLACSYDCSDTDSRLKLGYFKYVPLETMWAVQEHIRNWGSVVSRLDVYSDFKPFFEANPGGVYPGHGRNATYLLSHAIQLVGYSNGEGDGWWLAKNSWGSSWASGGFFKIAFGQDGVCSSSDTFGIKFLLNSPGTSGGRPMHRLSPSRSRPGCYDYRALPSDYVSRVASVFGLPIQQVLYDNRGTIEEPDISLSGLTIVLCGIQSVGAQEPPQPPPVATPTPKAATPAPVPQPAPAVAVKPTPVKPAVVTPPVVQQQPPKPAPRPSPTIAIRPQPQPVRPAPQQQQQQQNVQPQQPVARAPPADRIRFGTYQGGFTACRYINSNVNPAATTLVVSRTGTPGIVFMDNLMTWQGFLIVSCKWHAQFNCRRSSRQLCGGDEGWYCWAVKYLEFVCGNPPPEQWLELCFSTEGGGTFSIKEGLGATDPQDQVCREFRGVARFVG